MDPATSSATELRTALEHRRAVISDKLQALEARVFRQEQELEETRAVVQETQEELDDIERLMGRYSPQQSFLAPDEIPGPTGAIVKLLRSQSGQRMKYADFLDRMEVEITKGNVKTNARGDPRSARKLVSAMVAQMEKSEKVVRVRDMIYLPGDDDSTKRKRPEPGPGLDGSSGRATTGGHDAAITT